MSKKQFRILITLLINVLFVIVEFVGGILTNSVAILSDAIHDTGDVIMLTGSLFIEKAAEKAPDDEHTFGHQRYSLVASVLNSMILIAGGVFILTRAIPRLIHPEKVDSGGMLIIAILGVILNSIAFMVIRKGQSVNENVLTWHMIEDIGGWIVVLVGSTIISFTHWLILDPILSILFTCFIAFGVIRNQRKAFRIFMQGVPVHINPQEVREIVLTIDGVIDIHDVHIWSLDGDHDVMSAHIVYAEEANTFLLKNEIKEKLKSAHIEHTTLELELEGQCSDEQVYEEPTVK